MRGPEASELPPLSVGPSDNHRHLHDNNLYKVAQERARGQHRCRQAAAEQNRLQNSGSGAEGQRVDVQGAVRHMAVAASNLQLEPEEVAEDQDDFVQPRRPKQLDDTEVREEATSSRDGCE